MTAPPVFIGRQSGTGSTGQKTMNWSPHVTGDIGILLVESSNEVVTLATPSGFVQIPSSPQGTGAAGAGSVNFGASSEHTAAADPQNHTHTPSGTAKGVIVFIVHGTSSADKVSGVTYGGVAMTRVRTNIDSASPEPGRVYAYFLGSSIPTGAQTVSVDRTDATTVMHVTCITVTSGGNTEVIDHDGISEDAQSPSVTLQNTGRNSIAFAAYYCGNSSPSMISEGAGCSFVSDWDFDDAPAAGSFSSEVERQTTPGTSDFTIGFTTAAPEDNAFCALSVGQVAAAGATRLTGFWARATNNNMPDVIIEDPGDHVYVVLLVFRNCVAIGSPFDVSNGNTESSALTAVTIPGATTLTDNCLVVAAVTHGLDVQGAMVSGWTNANLSQLLERHDGGTDVGDGGGIAVATGVRTVKGNYGNTTATLATGSAQGRISFALKPFIPLPPTSEFVTIVDPLNFNSSMNLRVLEDDFKEDAVEWRGNEFRAWNGSWLSDKHTPKRSWSGTAEFLAPADLDLFRLFIDVEPNAAAGTFVGAKPMLMTGGVMRGKPAVQVMIELGEARPVDYTEGHISAGLIMQAWRAAITLREI